MGTTVKKKIYSVEEYLEVEKQGDIRYEFLNGEMYAMSGASRIHNELAGNTYSGIKNSLKGKGCKVYMEGVKVELVKDQFYVYPDVVVTCDPDDREDKYFVKKPSLIVEVLSKSTSVLDTKGRKFLRYLNVPSLQYYVVVSQDFVYVGAYERKGDDWIFKAYEDLTQSIPLDKWGIQLNIADIYEEVALAPEE